MPIERIRITPQEFRATSASSNVTFSSSNKYFKTTTNGAFRVGGFDRAPFIFGTSYQTDRVHMGGYLEVMPGGYTNEAIGFEVPFSNSVLTMCGPDYAAGDTATDGYYFYQIINHNNYFLRSPNRQYTINGEVAGTYTLYMFSAPFQGAASFIHPWGFDYSKPGFYQFGPRNIVSGTWYNQSGALYNMANFNDNNHPWKPLALFFTQPTLNIDLAATV